MFRFLIFTALTSAIAFHSKAQFTVDFQNVNFGTEGYVNGSDLSGGIASGGLFFPNSYNAQFGSWSGFSVSSKADTATAGFGNQYSTYAGPAPDFTNKYGLVYLSGQTVFKNANLNQSPKLTSFQFTNSTYTALSMKNGDAFTKKFGGVSGNEPDFLKIFVFNHFEGRITDSAELFLADFTSSNNSQDYIVKNWRTANLNFLNPFDSISFKMQSTDIGSFGMNTPAYFCIDNIQYSATTEVTQKLSVSEIKTYPNPFQNQLQIQSKSNLSEIKMKDQMGRRVEVSPVYNGNQAFISTNELPSGIYFLEIAGQRTQKLIKN